MQNPHNEEATVIFRAFITLKNGKRIFAHQFGLKGFPIRIRNPRSE